MNCKHLISVLFPAFLLVACNQREVDLCPGAVYRVTTTEGEGFAVFEHVSERKWTGVYYLNEGQLESTARPINLKIGKELVMIDDTGHKTPLLGYVPYEEPAYIDHPETWEYNDSVYAVTTQEDICYGQAQGYWISYPDTGEAFEDILAAKEEELDSGKKMLDLTMDLYIPNDTREISRPLLVLIHDGGFFNGDKASLGYPQWARYFAGLGYVVASVNYRLGFQVGKAAVEQAGFRAVQDVDAAIRYIIHNKDSFAVDPKRVFVAGASAGGITALNLAFMREENIPDGAREEGGIHSVNPEMKESYTIRGVGNMWGAVNDLTILNNSTASVISFHNRKDRIVPFDEGYPFKVLIDEGNIPTKLLGLVRGLVMPKLYGSNRVTSYLGPSRAVLHPYDKTKSYDHTPKHSLHLDRDEYGEVVLCPEFYEIEETMRDYFSTIMLPSPVVLEHSNQSQTFRVLSTDLSSLYWKVEGGVILKQDAHSIDVLFFPDATSHAVTASGTYSSGNTYRKTWSY